MNTRRTRRTRRTRVAPGGNSRRAGAMSALRNARRRLRQRRNVRHRDRRRNRPATSVTLIGLDVSRAALRLQTRSWAPLVVAALAGGLFLATLRTDVLRMRFSVAERFEQQLQLEQQKRQLTVKMRQLRDPAELSQRARALGFRRAERLIDLRGAGSPDRPAVPMGRAIELASVATTPDGAAQTLSGLPLLPGEER